MRRFLLLILVCVAASAVTAAASAATLGPRFLGGPGVRSKPPKIGVGAKGGWERLRWSKWGKKEATAHGVYDIAGFAGEPVPATAARSSYGFQDASAVPAER